MIIWNNMDTLAAYQELLNAKRVDLAAAMSGDAGALRAGFDGDGSCQYAAWRQNGIGNCLRRQGHNAHRFIRNDIADRTCVKGQLIACACIHMRSAEG